MVEWIILALALARRTLCTNEARIWRLHGVMWVIDPKPCFGADDLTHLRVRVQIRLEDVGNLPRLLVRVA